MSNRAARRRQARAGTPATPSLSLPVRTARPTQTSAATIPLWSQDSAGRVTARREAEFWHPLHGPGRRIGCTLCYRKCELADGEAGFCVYRHNERGRMIISEHGILAAAMKDVPSYTGGGPWFTYLPGLPVLSIGATRCTSSCSFCSSAEIVWRPEAVPWLRDRPRGVGVTGGWGGQRALLHPTAAMAMAREWGAGGVLFGINEPMVSYEYTLDVATLAKAAGLVTLMNTNGFAPAPVIRRLAPFMDAVLVGVKGSASPNFYTRYMHADGALPTVLAALETWKAAGVHVIVGDLIAAPHMQADDAAEAAQWAFYRHVDERLGPETELLLYGIHRPKRGDLPLMPGAGPDAPADVIAEATATITQRVQRAAAIGRAAGLPYTRTWDTDHTGIRCHQCGGLLLRKIPERDGRVTRHTQHVTGGRCDHCGARVPIATLDHDRLAAMWDRIDGDAAWVQQ